MKSLSIIPILIFPSVFLICCGQVKSDERKDSVKDTVAITKQKTDTVYFNNGDLIMQVMKGNKIVERRILEQTSDTFYYDNGKPSLVISGPSADFESKQYEYYHNGQLKKVFEIAVVFGCSNQVDEEINYDSLGNLLSKSSFHHSLPAGATDCHETYTVTSTSEYYANGKIKLNKKTKTGYEAAIECDCGTWEYYDENGKLVKKEKHPDCMNYKFDCE